MWINELRNQRFRNKKLDMSCKLRKIKKKVQYHIMSALINCLLSAIDWYIFGKTAWPAKQNPWIPIANGMPLHLTNWPVWWNPTRFIVPTVLQKLLQLHIITKISLRTCYVVKLKTKGISFTLWSTWQNRDYTKILQPNSEDNNKCSQNSKQVHKV